MKKFDFIIGYDIASAKRLQQLAKLLENSAIRIQYSLFFYPDVSMYILDNLKEKIENIINKEEDDVRIYRIDIQRSIHLGTAIDLRYPFLFLSDNA